MCKLMGFLWIRLFKVDRIVLDLQKRRYSFFVFFLFITLFILSGVYFSAKNESKNNIPKYICNRIILEFIMNI